MGDDDVVAKTAPVPAHVGLGDLSGSVVADRYHLLSVIGQGAMANVYRATDGRLDREVAVKLFHRGQDAPVRTRFAAEAQVLARLSHPGLVGVYDAGVEGDRSYLVMQLVDGESLRERLLGGPLDCDDVVLLGARLSMALAHVHANGVVHRDIKPSNIVLDSNGSPHLADFGIALLLDSARMTGTGEIMGTAAYLSPEQILGADVGAAADIYSLGLVLLECITGELEYPGVSKVESAIARLHRPPRMPAGIPNVLAQLLTAMTARVPEDRPSAGDCAAWFWAVREHSGMSSRAARLAAAQWLARKGGQLNRSRIRQPLLSGWRRYAIAGSGIAMAILASTWLFTSLLPRVMPPGPLVGTELAPDPNNGASGGGSVTPPALHMAAALTAPRRNGNGNEASPVGDRNPGSSTSQDGTSSQLAITSTLIDGSGSSSVSPTTTPLFSEQDSSEPPINAGPASPPPSTDDGSSSGPPPTTDTPTPTNDGGSGSASPSTNGGMQFDAKHGDGQGNGNGQSNGNGQGNGSGKNGRKSN